MEKYQSIYPQFVQKLEDALACFFPQPTEKRSGPPTKGSTSRLGKG